MDAARTGRLARIAPGLQALRHYRREDLRADVVAGLSVAAVSVPIGIAYARLAGFEPAVGLYASIAPLLAYALFGTSPQLMVGPSAAASALVGAAIAPLAGGDAALYQSLSVLLALLVGVLCLGASVLRLGALADFLSRPILIGFMNGVALGIALGQIGPLLGFRIAAGGIVPRLLEVLAKLGQTHLPTLAVGVLAFVALGLAPRLLPRLPAALVAMVAAGGAVHLFGLERAGVATIGPVPGGFPALRWPAVPAALLPTIVAEAAGLALVSFSSMMLAARSFAARNRYDIDADREAAALGAANLAAALSQGFVVSGTNSRTAIADKAGGRTQVTGLICAAAVTTVLLFLTAPLRVVPLAALGAVLMNAAWSLVDVAALRALRRIDPTEFWLSILATIGVVVVGAINAILVVVVLALLRFVSLTARPRVELLGAAADRPGLVLLRFNGPVVFFTAPTFTRAVLAAADGAGPALRWFVLDLMPVSMVDATGLYAIRDAVAGLRARGVVVAAAGRVGDWADWAAARGFGETVAQVRIFATLDEAVEAFRAEGQAAS